MGLWDKYRKTDDGNNFPVSEGGAAEGWTGSQTNDWGRTVMKEVRLLGDDPQWVYPLYDISNPRVAPTLGNHGLTINKQSATVIRIVASESTRPTFESYFAVGRRCVLYYNLGNSVTYATVVSVGGTVGSIDITFDAIVDGNPAGEVPSGVVDLGVYFIEPETDRSKGPNSAVLFSGYGSATDRATKFPTPDDLSLWFENDTDRLLVGSASSWRDPIELAKPVYAKGSNNAAAATPQVISAGLETEAGSFRSPVFDVSYDDSGTLERRSLLTWNQPEAAFDVNLYDDDEALQTIFRLKRDGSILISPDAGSSFSSALSVIGYDSGGPIVVDMTQVLPGNPYKNITIASFVIPWVGLTKISLFHGGVTTFPGTSPNDARRSRNGLFYGPLGTSDDPLLTGYVGTDNVSNADWPTPVYGSVSSDIGGAFDSWGTSGGAFNPMYLFGETVYLQADGTSLLSHATRIRWIDAGDGAQSYTINDRLIIVAERIES